MKTSLDTETALLVELLEGPGYGLDLIDRVQVRSERRIRLRRSVVYPTLRGFKHRKLVRSWNIATPGCGRPRTYYELTMLGLATAQAHRDAITAFVKTTAPRRPSRRELKKMTERLFLCGELSEAAAWLRRVGRSKTSSKTPALH